MISICPGIGTLIVQGSISQFRSFSCQSCATVKLKIVYERRREDTRLTRWSMIPRVTILFLSTLHSHRRIRCFSRCVRLARERFARFVTIDKRTLGRNPVDTTGESLRKVTLHDKPADYAVLPSRYPSEYYIPIPYTFANITDNTLVGETKSSVNTKILFWCTTYLHLLSLPLCTIIPVVFNAPLSWTKKQYWIQQLCNGV